MEVCVTITFCILHVLPLHKFHSCVIFLQNYLLIATLISASLVFGCYVLVQVIHSLHLQLSSVTTNYHN